MVRPLGLSGRHRPTNISCWAVCLRLWSPSLKNSKKKKKTFGGDFWHAMNLTHVCTNINASQKTLPIVWAYKDDRYAFQEAGRYFTVRLWYSIHCTFLFSGVVFMCHVSSRLYAGWVRFSHSGLPEPCERASNALASFASRPV